MGELIETPTFKLAVYAKGDKNADKLALVLPGRLDTKDYIHMRSHVNFLAENGYYALSFDMPGIWESPGDIKDYTTTNYIKIVHDLIEHFGNRPTLLVGHSRGGAVAILAGANNKNVTGIVPIMATYGAPSSPSPEDIKAGMHISFRDIPPGNTKTAEQKKFVLPLSYFDDGKMYNPAETLKDLNIPKLLIYGTQDEFTKPERVKEVYRSIPEPKMFLELDTEHDYRYHPEVIKKVNRTIAEFLEKYPTGDT